MANFIFYAAAAAFMISCIAATLAWDARNAPRGD